MDLDAALSVLQPEPQQVPKRLMAPDQTYQADTEKEAIYALQNGLAKRAYIKGEKPDFSTEAEPLSGAMDVLSSGEETKPVAAVASQPVVNASPFKTSSPNALPNTTMGRIGGGLLGEAKGAFDLAVEGPAQLLAHAAADLYPAHWPGAEFLNEQKNVAEQGRQERLKAFEEATSNVPASAKAGEIAGNVIGAMALPQNKAAEGANLINRMIAAAKTGGIIGLATPTEDKDFWTNKAVQTGFGALTAAVAQPVSEGIAKVIGATANGAMNLGKRVLNWASGNTADQGVTEILKNSSPELVNSVKQAVAKGQAIDPGALGRQVEADSLPVKMSLTAGQARQDPHLISAEMNTRGTASNQAMAYKLQDQEKSLFANLHAIRDLAAPDAKASNVIEAGGQLIKSGEDLISKHDEMTSALYKKLTDANGGSLPIDGISFVDSAESALKNQMKTPFLPSEVKQVMEGIKDSKGEMTFENFENLRTMLASATRKAERAGDGNQVGALSIVRNALENVPISSDVGEVKALADAARASAKHGFDMLRTNPALASIDKGKALDTTFVQKYLAGPGASTQNIKDLAETFQHDPETLQTMKSGVINYLESASSRGGNFSQSGYNKALQALGPKLDIIFGPDEAQHLRTLGNVARYTQLAPRGAYVNSSNTDVANLARHGGGMAARFVDKVFGVPVGSAAQTAAEVAMEKRAQAKTLGQIVNIGAGVGEPSNQSEFLLNRLPKLAGSAATIPLSVMVGQGVKEKSRQQAGER